MGASTVSIERDMKPNAFSGAVRVMTPTLVCLVWLTCSSFAAAPSDAHWPRWRGPLDTGEAPNADPPIEWSADKNLRWKLPIPGHGHSTPVIWGDRIYLTSARPIGDPLPKPRYSGREGAHNNLPITNRQEFAVIAISRSQGKIEWSKPVRTEVPHEGAHESGSLASNSPVTDGKRVYAYFGSRGLFCLDPAGGIVWERQFGKKHTKHGHGEGASPTLHGETLIVNWDHQEKSFVVALNKKTGEQIWQRDRDELTSWATPIVVEEAGRKQVIVPGSQRVRAYDLGTGEIIWECGGLSANICASPVAGDGMAFAGSSYVKRGFIAVTLAGAKGDITGTDHVAWTRVRGTPYVPSPLLYRGRIHFFNHYQSVLTQLDARTGTADPGPFRLPGIGNIYASPVAAQERIYITDLEGSTLVLSAAAKPEVLALNHLDDSFAASPALAGNELYLRGRGHLYCIAED
jgi:outer membrane protein assembly factor BamB